MKKHALLFVVIAAACDDAEPIIEPVYSVTDECGANLTKVEPAWCTYKAYGPDHPITYNGGLPGTTSHYEPTNDELGTSAVGKATITCGYCTTCTWARSGAFDPAGIACSESPSAPKCNPPTTAPEKGCYSEVIELPDGWPYQWGKYGPYDGKVSEPPTKAELVAARASLCRVAVRELWPKVTAKCTSQTTETLGASCCVRNALINTTIATDVLTNP